MRRREFIGTVAAGLATPWPMLAAETPSKTRSRLNFNEGWLFRRQVKGGGALGSFDRDAVLGTEVEPAFRQAAQVVYDDRGWEEIFLPHTWNAHDSADEIAGYFRGLGWYRKHFYLDEAFRGKRVFLEFEGVNQVSEFWLNGIRIGEHKGGYTSFEFDVTPQVKFGSSENVLAVKVNNVFDPNIAPTIKTDLTFYGGIYRDAWLRVTPQVYLSQVFWKTPQVSASSAEMEIHTSLGNPQKRAGSAKITHEVLGPDGSVVATVSATVALPVGAKSEYTVQKVTVANPKLWSPDSPALYNIRTTLSEGGKTTDETETRLGFRWFSFDANKGFFLNGERVQLRGTTWHQSYPGMGDAVPNSRHYADMQDIRDMGCNFFRTSHYPHDPSVINACDKLGLLVYEELFVGEEVENTDTYFKIQAKTADEMVFRDRNNPSVIMWGLSGEVDDPQKSVEVVAKILNYMRDLDPTRVITMHDPRAEGVKKVLDVVGLYGTFEQDDRDHKNFPERKFLIEEYTAAAIGRGIYGGGPNSEELGCLEHEKFLADVNQRPWIAGSALWHQLDYDGEEYDPVVPHLVTFGMADAWRIPKDVYYFYQSQWASKKMVHICGHWTWTGEEGKKRSVKVYSNCEEVELFLNGRSLGSKKSETQPGLDFAPLVWEVTYEPGTLEAVAKGGGETIKDARKTAGPATAIQLVSDKERIESGNRDSLAYLTASVVDKDGTVLPHSFEAISFSSYGPGELLPQTWAGYPTGLKWNVIAGMTRIAFRATHRVGRAVVTAYTPGLSQGRVEIQVAATGKKDEMEYRSGGTIYK